MYLFGTHSRQGCQQSKKSARNCDAERSTKCASIIGSKAGQSDRAITSSAVDLRSSRKPPVQASSQPTMSINLDRQIDEDSSDGGASVIIFSPNNGEFPLITSVNRQQDGCHKEVASLTTQSYATLHRRSVEETDISDSSSDDGAEKDPFRTASSSGSSTPAHLLFTKEEILYLRQCSNGQSFYDLIGEEYTEPPLHQTSLLTSTALLHHNQDMPPVTEGDHLLSPAERDLASPVFSSKHRKFLHGHQHDMLT